ncbi:MAG: hypothetical protein MMC23_002501 [Stictis urceolatum]|nr:hypothetical protein [Stictis urceolata]
MTLDVADERVEFIALDFTGPKVELVKEMKEIYSSVTHSYFSSYIHKADFAELNKANSGLFENYLGALIKVAPVLQNVTLQTGGKYYNGHLRQPPIQCRKEDPRLVSSNENFYYPHEDFLAEKQNGSKWTYNIIRPVGIVGTTSRPNGMNMAVTAAVYFLVCKELDVEARMGTNQLY